MKVDKIYKGKYAPNPVWYEYWIDLSADVYGGVIKYYNGSEWVKIVDEVDLSDYAKTSDIPTNVSELANDANYVTSAELDAKGYQTEEDCAEAVTDAIADLVNSAPEALDTLYELAEALGNDPNFATTIATQLGQKVDTNTYEADKETFALKTEIPTNVSELNNDAYYVDSEYVAGQIDGVRVELDSKQDKLVSGTNIKTINSQSILGEGNIEITTEGGGITDAPSDDNTYGRKNGAWEEINIPDTSDVLTKTEAATTYQTISDSIEEAPSDNIVYGRRNQDWVPLTDPMDTALMEENFTYGVEWDTTVSDPTLTRIGNLAYHKSLPIQSQMKGCVANGNEINYWLDPNDWNYKADGTPSVLDGTDGTVRVYIPKFYGKSEIDGTTRRVRISTIKIDDTYTEIPAMLVDAYMATVDTTEGTTTSTAKMVSVVNKTENFRGGNNRSDYDSYDEYRTDLGKPRTSITRANARLYARNANAEVLCYEYYKWIFYWLPVIEYATFNLQLSFNDELSSEGYHQGGLGSGATNGNYSRWGIYNSWYPVIPCGIGNSLGNFTGAPAFNIPETQVTITQDTTMTSWSTLSGATGTVGESINVTNVSTANSNATYRQSNYCGGVITYNVSGLEDGQSVIFYRNGTCATATSDGDIIVDWGTDASQQYSYIQFGFTGDCNITISLVSAEECTYTVEALSGTVARYRGLESCFGDIYTTLDGVLIYCDSSTHPNDYYSDVYTTTDPDLFGDNASACANMTYKGTQADSNGYIIEFTLGSDGDIIPESVGGSSTTYKCDYNYYNTTKDRYELLRAGGHLSAGSLAGPGFFDSLSAASQSAAIGGFRTYTLVD